MVMILYYLTSVFGFNKKETVLYKTASKNLLVISKHLYNPPKIQMYSYISNINIASFKKHSNTINATKNNIKA